MYYHGWSMTSHLNIYQKILTSDVICIHQFYVLSQSKLSQLHLSVPVLSLSSLSSTLSSLYNFLTLFLSNLKPTVVLYVWRTPFYVLVLGCQVQPFLALIILLCISDIWLACWLLVSSWCHIKFPLGFYVAIHHSCTMYLPHARGGPGVYPCLVHPLGNSTSRVVHIAVVAMKLTI